MSAAPRVGVVGHVEWIQFAVVGRLPAAGEIAHATSAFELAAGGGAVAAAELARLAGGAEFFTAVGDDDHGARAVEELRARGITVHAAVRPGATTRRGVTFLDGAHERTITLLDPRLVPHIGDRLPWERLAEFDAVYVTGGDAGALRAARAARVLVATARAVDVVAGSGVAVDALVASAHDAGERVDLARLDPPPRAVVQTRGAAGGTWAAHTSEQGTWDAVPPPGPAVDAYGCGDAFAAGLTYGLGAGRTVAQAAAIGAERGADCLTRRGPYRTP